VLWSAGLTADGNTAYSYYHSNSSGDSDAVLFKYSSGEHGEPGRWSSPTFVPIDGYLAAMSGDGSAMLVGRRSQNLNGGYYVGAADLLKLVDGAWTSPQGLSVDTGGK
jgi:hypothetical protein